MSRVGCQVCVLMKGTDNRVSVRILKFAKQMPKAFATGENKCPRELLIVKNLHRVKYLKNERTDVEGTQPNHVWRLRRGFEPLS
jgi:hypothetical protein